MNSFKYLIRMKEIPSKKKRMKDIKLKKSKTLYTDARSCIYFLFMRTSIN